MSRIYEALKKAQYERADLLNRKPARGKDRRVAERTDLRVPVFVYGHHRDHSPFHQETHSVNVSASGGLLALGFRVRRGQKLLLTHAITQQEQPCVVVRAGKDSGDHNQVAVTFRGTAADFWTE
ncbi:MAG: hypothetical protein HY046_01685 [Acidobacteria bacterium]|nr:hypothetical protein [Acidobacteriota bacterium]